MQLCMEIHKSIWGSASTFKKKLHVYLLVPEKSDMSINPCQLFYF